jgi:hypothetical protein
MEAHRVEERVEDVMSRVEGVEDVISDLPQELLNLVLSFCDARSLCMVGAASRDSPLSVTARRDELWHEHLVAAGIGCIGDQPLRVRYLRWRWAVFGARSQLIACERRELPFLHALGHPRAIGLLPPTLTYGLVCDIVKLHEAADSSTCKYRESAAWIARRTRDPNDVDERRLSAALREAYQRCFPPVAQGARDRRAGGRRRKPSKIASSDVDESEREARDAFAERLSHGAVRTACDTFGRYHVEKSAPTYLRFVATKF